MKLHKRENRIEDVKQHIFNKLAITEPGTPEYTELLKQLDLISSTKQKTLSLVNPTIISGFFHLTGVGWMLNFEKMGIVRTKAMSLLPKIRS
jgi:hypothetical protein